MDPLFGSLIPYSIPDLEPENRPKVEYSTTHCPLCTYSEKLPDIEKIKRSALIFLDPTVLINHSSKPVWKEIKPIDLDVCSLSNFMRLIETIEKTMSVAIILNSSYTSDFMLEDLRETIFKNYPQLNQRIIGKTPADHHIERSPEWFKGCNFNQESKEKFGFNLSSTPAWAVRYWLAKHHLEEDETNFIVVAQSHHVTWEFFKKRFIAPDVYFCGHSLYDATYRLSTPIDNKIERGSWRLTKDKDAENKVFGSLPRILKKFSFKYFLSDFVLKNSINQIAVNVSKCYASLLTEKGYSRRSIFLNFGKHPNEFPPSENVKTFKNLLFTKISKKLSETFENKQKAICQIQEILTESLKESHIDQTTEWFPNNIQTFVKLNAKDPVSSSIMLETSGPGDS